MKRPKRSLPSLVSVLPALVLIAFGGRAGADGMPEGIAAFTTDYAPRANFGARLEPLDGVIHGAGQDPAGYLEYSALFEPEHRPMMFMTYITVTAGEAPVLEWREQVRTALSDLAGQGTTLQIGLNLTAGKDDGSGRAGQVATGAYDAAVDAFVESLRMFGVPAWVRIGYEFEGSWNGYSPEGYVAAFRYITDRIRDAGIDDIATVWCAASCHRSGRPVALQGEGFAPMG